MQALTGLVMERGALGVWLVGEAGAILVRPGGRRVHCWCVRAQDASLPSADRIAHLLLALRSDEQGFATVANLAFSGARRGGRRRRAPLSDPRPGVEPARRDSIRRAMWTGPAGDDHTTHGLQDRPSARPPPRARPCLKQPGPG